MFDIINIPLGWIIKVCYNLVNNYFFALLLFAVVMQLLLLPFSVKQQKNSIRQASLAPKVAALRKKYAGRTDAATQQKMNEETMELYRRENFSPAAGCLPMLIQMPILLALYQVVMNPLRYISGLSAAQITELQTFMTETQGLTLNVRAPFIDMLTRVRQNVGDYTGIIPDLGERILPDMTVLGLDLSQIPPMALDLLVLVPILTFIFAYLSQIIIRRFTYQSPETKEAQKSMSMRIMNASMPLLSVWIAFSVPAAIGIYWIFRNILSTVQQIILAKVMPVPRFTEEDYKAAEKEMKVGRPVRQKSKVPPRSLHHIDDEEYQAKLEAAREKAEAEAEAEAVTESSGENAGSDKGSAPEAAGESAAPAPTLKEDPKTAYEKKKISPSAGKKYDKTGRSYKK